VAWAIARKQFPGRTLLLSIIDIPFAISPVVAGLMIVLLYGRNGWFGPLLDANGIKIIFAVPGMVLATAFVTMPFVAREVIPVLEESGADQEEAAETLGARGWQIFWRVTLPNIRWGLLYGLILTNARAMGEFGAVSVVSGNITGKTQTLPLFVEEAYKQYETQAAYSAAVLLALLAVVTLVLKEILERKTKIKDVSE
jgi:sulfate transport system permease protein